MVYVLIASVCFVVIKLVLPLHLTLPSFTLPLLCSYRTFGKYGYTGVSFTGLFKEKQGTGYDALYTQRTAYDGGSSAFRQTVSGTTFVGFSGKDACGRTNVALSNEMAADGEGATTVFAAAWGKATCYPTAVNGLKWVDTPDYARLAFASGPTAAGVQWGLCTLADEDRSLFTGSAALDASVATGSYFLKSSLKHDWPPEVLRDCGNWARLGYPDEYEGVDTCLWWLKAYADATSHGFADASKRGLVEGGFRGAGSFEKGVCEPLWATTATNPSGLANNVQLCTGLEYVLLKSIIPEKKVSGSELIYGPVGYLSQRSAMFGSSVFAGEDTVVDIYRAYSDPRSTQVPPQVGGGDSAFTPAQSRYTQPYLANLVNGGYYRVQYTGDITAFNDGVLEYSLVGLATDAPMLADDFGVVLDIKFMKAVNLAVYHNGKEVKMASRRDKISLEADPGTW